MIMTWGVCNIMDYKLSGSGSSAALHKILEQARARGAGAFRVELDAGEIGALDNRRERRAVPAAGERERVHGSGEAVDKIKAGFRFDPVEQANLAAGGNRVPAHMGDGNTHGIRQQRDVARND